MFEKPRDYDVDTGVALTFDTLCDRGFDAETVKKALDAAEVDLWWTIYGPAVDKAAELIGLDAYPEGE